MQMNSITVIISIYIMIIEYKIILVTSLYHFLLLLSYPLNTVSRMFRLREHSSHLSTSPLPSPSIYFQDTGQGFSPFMNCSYFPQGEGIASLPSIQGNLLRSEKAFTTLRCMAPLPTVSALSPDGLPFDPGIPSADTELAQTRCSEDSTNSQLYSVSFSLEAHQHS